MLGEKIVQLASGGRHTIGRFEIGIEQRQRKSAQINELSGDPTGDEPFDDRRTERRVMRTSPGAPRHDEHAVGHAPRVGADRAESDIERIRYRATSR